jgi:lambda family phage portal protein
MRATIANAIAPKPLARSFDAANYNRLVADWVNAYSRSADAETRYTLRTMRNRAREQVQNSALGIRYWQLLGENVIGADGIGYQAKNVTKEGKLFVAANKALEAAWEDAGRIEHWDLEQRLTRKEQLSLAASNWGSDGEILIRLFRGPAFGPYGFNAQLLDPDFLDDQLNREAIGGQNAIRQGVEFDAFGRPVAYYLFARHPFDTSGSVSGIGQKHVRVDANDIIHAFIPVRPGQTRGIPHSAAIMTTLKMLDGYIEAELVAARVASAKMGAIEDADPKEPMHRNPNAGATAVPTEAEPATLMDLRGTAGSSRSGTRSIRPRSSRPSPQRSRAIAAIGLGLAYSTLTGDHSNDTYSSMKVGLQPEHVHWRRLQGFVIDHVLDRLFGEWLKMALLNSAIPGITDFDASRWRTHVWQPRGFPSPDPLKDTQANLMKVAAGIDTLTRLCAEDGLDFEEVIAERKRENDLATRRRRRDRAADRFIPKVRATPPMQSNPGTERHRATPPPTPNAPARGASLRAIA